MKLKAFRVQNYKNIRDTAWIACEDLMVFVGKNEAGKTALFRALSKLKPTDGSKYDGLKEFPHGRYTDEFKTRDWPVASGRFDLDREEREKLGELCVPLAKTREVWVTRYYSDSVEIEFTPELKLPDVSEADWESFLEGCHKKMQESVAPDGKGEAWTPIKANLINSLTTHLSKLKSDKVEVSFDHAQQIQRELSAQMSQQWTKEIIQPLLDDMRPLYEKLEQHAAFKKAEAWVIERMPFFLYFGNYEVLRSAIYLPSFVTRVMSGDKSPQTRVQNALFKHVGVDITQLARLGQHQQAQGESEEVRKQIDELDIKANSASIAMTRKFSDWWEQRRHKFSYKFHGDYFRVWVSDNRDPVDVELEERSLGMQYFFSFYLLFLVEAEEQHRNCILLLDEPGLHLHGTAQGNLISFLQNLSKHNQLFYTTHSPFMIDGAHLERARAVYETPEGTQVSADVWPRDKDTLFPLQAALGYSVCQTLFVAKKQVLVEGLTDYMLLGVLNEKLRAAGKAALPEDVILLPMGGTTNLAPLASLLAGHDIELAILLDSDKPSDSAIKKLRNVITDVSSRCVQIREALEDDSAEELEQLIPEQYYLKTVRRAYPNVELDFTDAEKQIANVTDRLKALFDRKQLGRFEKWRPMEQIVRDVNADSDDVPVELYDMASRVLSRINEVFVRM